MDLMNLDPRWWIAFLSAILALGFLWGLVVNRRLGRQLYRTLREVLASWGSLTQARWLGGATSGVYLALQEGRPPVRRMEAVLLLEPREFLPVWLAARWLRGQRDALILRVTFRRAPHTEWEWRRKGRRVRGFPLPRKDEGFTPIHQGDFTGWARPLPEEADGSAWSPFLETYRDRLLALSLRKQKPHLMVQVEARGLDMHAFLGDLMQAVEAWL